jgi:hypothetical protein
MLANVHPDVQTTVYAQEYWWSDNWDAVDYGTDFDFNRPFFEQFKELYQKVPRPNLFTTYLFDENCDYVNYSGMGKNNYLTFDSDYNRDTYYVYSANNCTNSSDGFRIIKCELCYEAVDCKNCYNCKYIQDCNNCQDSAFLQNCEGCKNCFMSFNMQHKEYYAFNKPVSKEEYEALMKSLSSYEQVQKYRTEFKELSKTFPKKFMHGLQNEDVSGDYIFNCKNVHESYDCDQTWGGKNLTQTFGVNIKDCMDCDIIGENAELSYECSNAGYNLTRAIACLDSLHQISDIMYCSHVYYSSNCFGCVGLRRKKYCILNKQYTKEEYENLVPRIIEHMRKAGEWGEFFPENIFPFAYNESLAMMYKPLTKEQVLTQGYTWRDDEKKSAPASTAPSDNIHDAADTVTKEIFACETCSSNYRIIPQELNFYRSRDIPIPHQCFKCRNMARLAQRNPRHLWDRNCAHCSAPIRTSYAPERPEQVYCEKCYLKAVY